MSPSKELPILICCDADPDRERFGAPSLDHTKALPQWLGIQKGLPSLFQELESIRDVKAQSPKFTWLLRSDEQMDHYHQDYGAGYSLHTDLWQARLELGDELGWHPHYWRQINGLWQQEQDDETWKIKVLNSGHQALTQHFPIETVKTGWCTMDQITMNHFRKLGIKSDTSSMPYQQYSPQRDEDKPYYGKYDWAHCSEEPYFPSEEDYQTHSNQKNETLLEVPISVGKDPLITNLENLVLSIRRGQWPKRRLGQEHTSLKLSFNPWLFRRLWNSKLKTLSSSSTPFVHVYFHPDECLPERGRLSWIYHRSHFATNLKQILSDTELAGWKPQFMTVANYRVK